MLYVCSHVRRKMYQMIQPPPSSRIIRTLLLTSLTCPTVAKTSTLLRITPRLEQGRIHGNPVADGWAGAVVRKPLGIQKCDLPTFLPTDTASSRVACPRLKTLMYRLTKCQKVSYQVGRSVGNKLVDSIVSRK